MAEHVNLFSYGDEHEVYAGLQRDYKRDGRQAQIMDLVATGAVVWLTRTWQPVDIFAAVALFWAFSAGTRTFIDNSNRNFFLHAADGSWFRRHSAATSPPLYHPGL